MNRQENKTQPPMMAALSEAFSNLEQETNAAWSDLIDKSRVMTRSTTASITEAFARLQNRPKRKVFRHLKLSHYVTLVFLCVVVGSYLLSEFVTYLLKRFLHTSFLLPEPFGTVVLGILIGSVLTIVLGNVILQPLSRLNDQIRKVAEGDFSIQLETKSRLGEVADLYDNFNLMVRELASTETLQADFVSSISHEIRTPINAIEGYSMLLQGNPQIGEEQAEYIEKILLNTRRLSALTSDILLLSKLENQVIPPERTSFRVDEQIRSAVVALETKWETKNIEPVAELPALILLGIEPLLSHVWLNLIDNAVKYSPEGSTIRIRLHVEEKAVLFTVEDEGPGIPPGCEERIFEKFYRADPAGKREGCGLGLALVRRIVNMHGGTVTAENRQEGGARLIVRLPAE